MARIFALALLLLSLISSIACAKSLASERASLTTLNLDSEKVRVIGVRQHEDRMPVATDDGRAVQPRVITILTFEADACVGSTNADFRAVIAHRSQTALVKIESDGGTCSENARARFEVATNELRTGEPVVMLNPVLVDLLAATE